MPWHLASGMFDLVLIGRRAEFVLAQLDERISAVYPYLPILQIKGRGEDLERTNHAWRVIEATPKAVLQALEDMLLEACGLTQQGLLPRHEVMRRRAAHDIAVPPMTRWSCSHCLWPARSSSLEAAQCHRKDPTEESR